MRRNLHKNPLQVMISVPQTVMLLLKAVLFLVLLLQLKILSAMHSPIFGKQLKIHSPKMVVLLVIAEVVHISCSSFCVFSDSFELPIAEAFMYLYTFCCFFYYTFLYWLFFLYNKRCFSILYSWFVRWYVGIIFLLLTCFMKTFQNTRTYISRMINEKYWEFIFKNHWYEVFVDA